MKYENLKKLRESMGLTQEDFAASLGLSKTTYNNYENGVRDPKSPFWTLVANKYHVTVDYLLGLVSEPEYYLDNNRILEEINSYDGEVPPLSQDAYRIARSLTDTERECIKKYRNLDDHGKKIVGMVLEEELQRIQDEENSKRVAVGDLAKVIYYDFPASAGTGIFLENEYPAYIEVPKDKIPAGTDFAIRISGDSMEPDYFDGDIVFVHQTEVRKGDTGIFVIDGDGYIKELGDGILISKNKNYKDIKINGNNELYTLGKVIGKLR